MAKERFSALRFLVRFFLLILLLLFGIIPLLLAINRVGSSIKVGHRSLDEFFLVWWTDMVCRTFGIRVRTSGLAIEGPVLMVANHISWLDILALYREFPIGFVSKAEIRKWPLIGMLTTMSGTVYLERGNTDSSSSVTQAVVDRLKQGGRVAIFPEGGIRPGDGVKVFHARLFAAAIEAECAIQPVMIRYKRDGRRDPGMTFMENETFMGNIVRLLGRPSSICEIRFLQPTQAEGRPRKELAGWAQAAITHEFEQDD